METSHPVDKKTKISSERNKIMTQSEGLTLGVIVGLMVGVVLVVLLLRFANKDKRIRTEYDERQKEIRGKGYTIGFYTIVGLLAAESLWTMSGNGFPLPDYLVFFSTIIIGLTVMCAYFIWKGVYWGINNNPKRYIVVMILAFLLNLIPIFSVVSNGKTELNGASVMESLPMMNVIVVLMLMVVGGELLIKHFIDKAKTEED